MHTYVQVYRDGAGCMSLCVVLCSKLCACNLAFLNAIITGQRTFTGKVWYPVR